MKLGFSTLGLLNVLAGTSLGLAIGIGGYTFVYARGSSYLSNDPAACANCHVMNDWYGAWMKSSHHAVAGCNDCHTPHDFFGKYLTKATNGFHHSMAFTTGRYPDAIRITPRNHAIAQESCIVCHASVVEDVTALSRPCKVGLDMPCSRCHGSVGHPF
jgi:cytochrome c nitrite reductase small subunit